MQKMHNRNRAVLTRYKAGVLMMVSKNYYDEEIQAFC